MGGVSTRCCQRMFALGQFGGGTRAGPAGEDASVPARYALLQLRPSG